MKFRLIPKNYSFFKYIEEFSDLIEETSKYLPEIVKKENITDINHSEKLNKKIYDLTVEGRQKSEDIVDHIEESFVTPIDREDLHQLAEKMLQVVEEIDDCSDGIVLHKIEKYDQYLDKLADKIVASVSELNSICHNFKNLKKISASISKIHKIQIETKQIFRKSIAHLFSGEIDSFEVLRLKNVYESFYEAVVKVNNVAELAKTISLKHA